ncbi:MAG: EVE domain-containing protein [Candidatus Latescibacterota bacterium]|jgi:predicted RNA-binding protein with PUA-like domain
MNYWLVKCEYDECTFDELKTRPQQTGRWRGVRNYQARNFIRDVMKKGDLAFFYQSNCDEPGTAGVVKIVKAGYPDPSQFDPEHKYYDEKATEAEPRWFTFDVKQHKAFKNFVHLKDLKDNNALKDMKVVQRGQRLSIQPVTLEEFEIVCQMGGI